MAGLLGNGPNRKIKIYREEFPAIFRFNGKLYQETYKWPHHIDRRSATWVEIKPEDAERWLGVKPPITKEET